MGGKGLGTFEGKTVTSASLSFLGKDEGFDEVLHDDDEIILVIKAQVQGIGFKTRKDGCERIHKMKILHALVPDAAEAKDFMDRIKAIRIQREEEALGVDGMLDADDKPKSDVVANLSDALKGKTTRRRSSGKDSRDQ